MNENQSTYPGSAPSTENHYVKVEGIDYEDFVLTAEAMPEEQKSRALEQLRMYLSEQQSNFLGYQVNQKFDYKKNLSEFLNIHINNIGDPFVSGNMTVSTKFVERAVLDYFASLWHARWPHEEKKPHNHSLEWKDSYWGYILSMGSSEGNLYALWNARDYLQGKYLLIDKKSKKSENNRSGMH
ncbi:MAG: hypothetical protein LBH50_03490, partial [Spirochaetaceae bacterium]|nr:hypothetical protein [Spirochaetaceae bacterium]